MTLGQKQELFAELLVEHCAWLFSKGYKIRFGDVFASSGHKDGSNHYLKLAADLNLLYGGVYLTKTSDHAESGKKWESRHPLCRWGGNWDKDDQYGEPGENDGNHYSLMHHGNM